MCVPAIQTATHVSALLQTLYEVLRWESITFNKAMLVLTVLHEMTPGVIVAQQVPVTYSNTGCTHTQLYTSLKTWNFICYIPPID